MRFIRHSVKTTGIQIKPQGYITFVTRAAPLIRPLTITQILLSENFHSLHKANMHCATWKKKSMEHALFCKIKKNQKFACSIDFCTKMLHTMCCWPCMKEVFCVGIIKCDRKFGR